VMFTRAGRLLSRSKSRRRLQLARLGASAKILLLLVGE
jgi:hypothetical protein